MTEAETLALFVLFARAAIIFTIVQGYKIQWFYKIDFGPVWHISSVAYFLYFLSTPIRHEEYDWWRPVAIGAMALIVSSLLVYIHARVAAKTYAR